MPIPTHWFSGPRHAAPVGSFEPVTGFLPKPPTELTWFSLPHRPASAQPLTFWHEDRVVVVLGEAGIGKSFELAQWFEARRSAGVLADHIDLRIESVDGLVERWRRRDVIERWLGGVGELELFLDGVDEFPAGVRSLTASLKSFIDGTNVNKLRLRVASRPGAWSEDLTRVFTPVAGNGEVVVLSLLPIEETDAHEAAERLGVSDPARFLEWVRDRRAESLASRPLTLQMLCDSIASGQQPPASRAELFERYLLRLFHGHQEQERALIARQRIEVASRIAAATLFAKRPLLVDFDRDVSAELVVELAELVGGHEGAGPSLVEITRSALRETIETGPFMRLNHGIFLWSSRAYEEYLGAWYLARRAQSPATLDAVLVNAADPKRRMVPALRGAIGWLADLKPEFWRDLARRDPRALIEAEPSARSPNDRAFLIDAWLKGIEAGAFTADGRELTERLGFLAHDGISAQLNAWLDTTRRQRDTVVAAAYLAKVTAALGCSLHLIALVEQPCANDPVRVIARYAFSALRQFMRAKVLPSEEQSRVLDLCRRALAFDESLDPEDDLLGYALDILWPEHLPTLDVLPVLRAPNRRNYFGSYWSFIYRFSRELEAEHFAAAIGWAATESSEDHLHHAGTVLENIIARSIDHLDDPEILRVVLEVVFDDHLSFSCPDPLRAELAVRASRPNFVGVTLAIGEAAGWDPRVVGYKLGKALGVNTGVALDGAWAGLAEATERADKERFAKAIEDWTFWNEEAPVSRLLTEGPCHPELARALEKIRKLGNESFEIVTEACRRNEEEMRKWANPEPKPVVLNPSLEQRVRDAIVAAQDGSSSNFSALLQQLHRRPTDRRYKVDWHVPVWETYGWRSTGDGQKDRILEATCAFLVANDPQIDKWLGKQQMRPGHAYMGLAAVRLLHVRGLLATLGDDILARWAPAVVGQEHLFDGGEDFKEILSLLLVRVPNAVADTWVITFEGENGLLSLRAFHEGWCPAVRDAFVVALGRQTEPKRLGHLLVELLRKDEGAAHAFAAEGLSWLGAEPGTLEREKGRQVAFALLRTGARGAAAVLDYLEGHGDEAREVLIRLGQDINMGETLAAGWSVDVVGRLAQLLVTHFPPPDQEHDVAYWVGPEESIREQRDRCLRVLSELAENEGWTAVDELARLERMFPDWKLVAYRRMEAVDRAGVASWTPPPPAEVLRIIREGVPAAHVEGALRQLEHFLCEHFSDGELRMLVRRLPHGIALAAHLLGALASLAQLANSVVEVLWRAGRIDEALFHAILGERAAFSEEIRVIAGMFKVDVSSQ